jgi:hypothetical protein
MASPYASSVKKKTANLIGFAAPVLLRPDFALLHRSLRARLEPSPEQRKAQEQTKNEDQQRE